MRALIISTIATSMRRMQTENRVRFKAPASLISNDEAKEPRVIIREALLLALASDSPNIIIHSHGEWFKEIAADEGLKDLRIRTYEYDVITNQVANLTIQARSVVLAYGLHLRRLVHKQYVPLAARRLTDEKPMRLLFGKTPADVDGYALVSDRDKGLLSQEQSVIESSQPDRVSECAVRSDTEASKSGIEKNTALAGSSKEVDLAPIKLQTNNTIDASTGTDTSRNVLGEMAQEAHDSLTDDLAELRNLTSGLF